MTVGSLRIHGAYNGVAVHLGWRPALNLSRVLLWEMVAGLRPRK